MEEKIYTIKIRRKNNTTPFSCISGTLDYLVKYFKQSLIYGKSYEILKGNKKININPKTINSLIINLNNCEKNKTKNLFVRNFYMLEKDNT